MLTLYGVAISRAFRCLWMLEELGVEYQHVPTDWQKGAKTPEYLRLNPNGRVPCLVDGELVMFESFAINLYLARKYQSPLWPSTLAAEALMLQWTLWGQSELDKNFSELSRQARLPEAERNPQLRADALAGLPAPLQVLEAQLGKSPYLLGAEFSLADLNVGAVVGTALVASFDLTPYPKVQAWVMGMLQRRPAAQRAVALALAAQQQMQSGG